MLRYDGILRDPVHGDVPLTREEMRVLDTVEMQRLRHVRQLGAAYLVYPGAQHSRFEHSVGTAHLVARIAEAVNQVRDRQAGEGLDGYDEHALRVVRLAALVHDATHLPFGHNIEDQTGLLPRHDVPERFAHMFSAETELGRALDRTGVREEVLAILAPGAGGTPPVPGHWGDLVSGTIDADMLDYLARDAMFTGLKLEYDPRIFNVFRADRSAQRLYVDLGRSGYLREAVLSEIVRCLEARYYFSERVYYHHAKIAAGSLVAKAVELALLDGALDLATLQRSTDAGLLEHLSRCSLRDPARRRQMETLVRALERRVLPKRAAVYPAYANRHIQQELIDRFFGSGSADERRRVEAEMGEELARRTGREIPVMLYCPAGHMQLKQAKMLVRWPGETGLKPLREFAAEVPRLGDLEHAYQRMWKFYVHALTDDLDELAALSDICSTAFPQAVNVLDHGRSGRQDSGQMARNTGQNPD